MQFNFMMYCYFEYVYQHVSASNQPIFVVMIQEYNCSSFLYNHTEDGLTTDQQRLVNMLQIIIHHKINVNLLVVYTF